MQKRHTNRVVYVLKAALILLLIVLIVELNAYLDLLVAEKYEIESLYLFDESPDMIIKQKQCIKHEQNIRLFVIGISAVLWTIIFIVRNFLKKQNNEKL